MEKKYYIITYSTGFTSTTSFEYCNLTEWFITKRKTNVDLCILYSNEITQEEYVFYHNSKKVLTNELSLSNRKLRYAERH